MRMISLRMMLVLDAVALILLGGAFVIAPGRMLLLFGFREVPPGVEYIVGTFGCVYATMAVGYVFATFDPIRHVAWVLIGIARGITESLFGLVCVGRGIVSFRQAGFGIVVPALIAVGYLLLYPRAKPPVIVPAGAMEDNGPRPT